MKKSIKLLIVIVTVFVTTAVLNVNAATGYTYDHRGQPIYSTQGLTINRPPYLASDLGIAFADFVNPEDFFIYEDSDGVEYIYIVTSGTNPNYLHILDGNYQLVQSVSSFTVNVDNFTDTVLREIKSNNNYVIARDQFLTIPHEMEYLYLVHELENPDRQQIFFELFYEGEEEVDYQLRWTSGNPGIAAVEYNDDDEPFIVTTGTGNTSITGTLYIVDDSEDEDQDEEVDEDEDDEDDEIKFKELAKVTINVTVTAEPLDTIPVIEKNHSFTIDEIREKGSFDLYLNGISSVYRAVTPTTGEDLIYLTDKGNNQVVVVDGKTLEVVKFVTNPHNVTFENRSFEPERIVTDGAGRMYIVSDNIYEGIMQFSREGEFNRFTGVNYVTLSPWEVFWRNFSTEAQLARQTSIINTSFTSMTVDDRGFIYATSFAQMDGVMVVNNDAMIKKINPSGADVLRRNGYQPPKGDVLYIPAGNRIEIRGPSRLRSITVNENGMYTVLDAKMGRLFTYDNEGNLLYVSGDGLYVRDRDYRGTQITSLSNPVSVRYHGENLVVLDRNHNALLVYELTDIGRIINKAAELEYTGDRLGAAKYWEEVVKQNANYIYAYVGIGKKHMDLGEYELAMEYFRIGQNRDLYSRAFKMERDTVIRQYFAPIMGTGLVAIVGLSVYKGIKRRNDPRYDMGEDDE